MEKKKITKIKTYSSKIENILKDKKLLDQVILIDKIRKAVLQMMKDVSFDEKKHIYTRTSDGTWLQGVSTVSSIVPKEWLSAWGAKEAVKFLGYSDYEGDHQRALEMINKIKEIEADVDSDGNVIKCEAEKFIELLKEAKGASFRKNKESLLDGAVGHAWLESYVKARIRGEELPKLPGGMLDRPLTQFIEWEKEDVDYWILSEARVANPEEGYAGTLDGLAMMKTGKLALIDFKFATRLSEDYILQAAGYQECFEKHGIHIDQRIIIRLPKTLEIEEWDEKKREYKKVENKIEVKIVGSDYQTDIEVFKHCLPLKKWINTILTNKK
jgi:hypothetical protein